MNHFFVTLLNMSLTASYVALIVMVIRFVFGKLRIPRIFSYALWAVVLIRLVLPVSFESAFSFLPGKTNVIPQNAAQSETPSVPAAGAASDHALQHSIQDPAPVQASPGAFSAEWLIEAGSLIWLLGAAVLIAYSFVSYARLRRKLAFATRRRGNIYESDQIASPFVLGFVRPRIYLPVGLAKQEADCIIRHERAHIRRYDHWIKPVFFAAVVLHWFNPLVWLSYYLMIKDMEMSCDETVIGKTNDDMRANYSRTLLALASKQSGLPGPLSFGESNVKSRVRNVLSYRRPALWIGVLAVAAVFALGMGLLADPADNQKYAAEEEQIVSLAGYITLDENMLYLDQVEVVTTEFADQMTGLDMYNPTRMAELDLHESDMPNGYYIHNPDAESIGFVLSDETEYTFTDIQLLFVEEADGDRRYTTTKKEEYIEYLSQSAGPSPFTGQVPYPVLVDVQGNQVLSVTEVFLFTQ